jgi:CRISPR-associated protein Cas5t
MMNMQCFCVEIATQTTSFRNPEFQNFHKSLDLPPPSTLIGFAGAALGLSPMMAQSFFEDTPFVAGISGFHNGRTTDTWKYVNKKKDLHLYDPALDGSVIKREQLIQSLYYLVFGSSDEKKLTALSDAILSPKFALTLGSSDSIVWVKNVRSGLTPTRSNNIKECLVPGDVVGEVLRKASNVPEFSIYHTSEPITYDFPTRFDYSSDYGRRDVSQTKRFSIVAQEMTMNYEVEGVQIENRFIPIFEL